MDEKLENNYNIEKVIYKRKNMDQFKIILPITIKKIQGISEEPAEND